MGLPQTYGGEMNLVYGNKDLSWLKRNPDTPYFRWDRPNGRVEIPSTPQLLNHTDFSTMALGQVNLPQIQHYSSDNTKKGIIVDNGGARVMRMNFNTVDQAAKGNDPISGQAREGNFTTSYNAGIFYNKSDHPALIYKWRYRLDDSYWSANVNEGPFPYPVGDGKIFLTDKTKDHEGPYLGFKNFDNRKITVVAGNGTGVWDPSTGWVATEDYGWTRTDGETPIGTIDLVCDDGYLMRTDGEWYEPTIEILYNPGNIGHNKIRFRSSTGSIYRDLVYGNTDEDGYLPMYLHYEFKGIKYYSSYIAFSAGRQDFTTNPELYSGYAGGIDHSDHWVSFGVID